MEHRALRAAPVEERHDDGHHDRCAADEDTRHRRFRAAFGPDDRQVETDHADGRQQPEAEPSARAERAQPPAGVPSGEWGEQQAGEGVAQELTAGVRIVAQDAVGGEGPADEHTGEGGEEGTAGGGGVHDRDARKRRGPV
ncbi:hypothetical protein FB157_12839 [Streptomyces sp. BK340]|nr:hypothetical protein FB157_12839 [Streptomyces sp. BK340]